MLKAIEHQDKKRRQYRKEETGNLVHVYEVFGPEEELQEYKDAQGSSNYKEDDQTGNPLFFTVRPFLGKSGILGISSKGKVYQDTSEMDKVKSIVESNGGNFGELIGKQMIADLLGNNAPVAQEQPAKAPADSDDLGKY